MITELLYHLRSTGGRESNKDGYNTTPRVVRSEASSSLSIPRFSLYPGPPSAITNHAARPQFVPSNRDLTGPPSTVARTIAVLLSLV